MSDIIEDVIIVKDDQGEIEEEALVSIGDEHVIIPEEDQSVSPEKEKNGRRFSRAEKFKYSLDERMELGRLCLTYKQEYDAKQNELQTTSN